MVLDKKWLDIQGGWRGLCRLIVANSLIDSDLSISDSKTQLGVAAVVFLAGVAVEKSL
jgi:hypothetical protein